MLKIIKHKETRRSNCFARHYGRDVVEVKHLISNPAKVVLNDGREGLGSCLGCGVPLCMSLQKKDMLLSGPLVEFPGDPNLNVCPTDAISWDHENKTIAIDASSCIGCGLCVARCPYGAISFNEKLNQAVVQTKDPDQLIRVKNHESKHSRPVHTGRLKDLNSTLSKDFFSLSDKLTDSQRTLLVRNLLIELGIKTQTRRKGDNNIRIDAVGIFHDDSPFAAEIELGNNVLESLRSLLEDVAVLHSRYGYDVKEITPINIISSLPSRRSEYYRLIQDIDKVIGLKIQVFTLGIIVHLLWSCATIDNLKGKQFTVHEDSKSLIKALANTLSLGKASAAQLREPYRGAFKPPK